MTLFYIREHVRVPLTMRPPGCHLVVTKELTTRSVPRWLPIRVLAPPYRALTSETLATQVKQTSNIVKTNLRVLVQILRR